MNSDEAYISRVLESLFSGLRYTRYRTDAQTGKLNSDGTLNTDVSDGLAAPYIWVRFGEDRAAVPVLSKIRDGAGIPVIVAFDTLINEDVVLEVNLARAIPVYGESATAYNIPVIPAGFFTPTNARDVQPGSLRADTTGGLNTRIVPCWLPGGTWWDGGTIITLVPTATSSKWSFVVVGIDSTGAVVQDLTADRALTYPLIDAEGNLTALGATDIQAVTDADPTVFWVGAALLANGATSIDGNRIYDTRFWRRSQSSFTAAGDSGSSQTVSEGDTLTVSGGVGLASVASATDTITLNLDVNSLTADASPDAAADYVATWDASASTHKKVLLSNLPGGGSSGAFTGDVLPSTFEARLTLETGVPISTTDQTAKTTVYLTPHKGNVIALYDGASTWAGYALTEISLSLSGFTADTNYDIFVYDNTGTVTLEAVAWTDATTRATALTTQNGVLVKSGATARRYAGTIRTTASTGQCEDSLTKRYLWNNHHRVCKKLKVTEATNSWTYNSATWRSWNNSTSNRVGVVVGVNEELVEIDFRALGQNSSNAVFSVGVGLDSTSTNSADVFPASSTTQGSPLSAKYTGYVGIGYHYLQLLESGNALGTTTLYGDGGSTVIQAGAVGTVWA